MKVGETMTPFSDVYARFLSKITDYDFLTLEEEDLEAELFLRLQETLGKLPMLDLELHSETQTFSRSLTSFEKSWFAQGMLASYLESKVYHLSNMRNHFSSKDFNVFSAANHLKQMIELHRYADEEFTHLTNQYLIYQVKEGLKR